MSRTRDEIAAHLRASKGSWFLPDVLLDYLDFDRAKEWLKPEATREQWEQPIGHFDGYGPPCDKSRPLDPGDTDHIREAMGHYAAFGWTKIEDHRGLSAGRTIEKMEAWLWLLCDDATLKAMEDAEYAQYGAPKLAIACRAYGFPVPDDDGIARMIEGRPCGADYECGCGR